MRSESLTTVLCRADIRRGQITLLKALYEEDNGLVPHRDDGYAARSDLAKIRRMKPDEKDSLDSVLGAFGNRINGTDGISGRPGTAAFLERSRVNGELHYRLRAEARQATENVPALLNEFDKPWGELLEPDTRIEAAELVAQSE